MRWGLISLAAVVGLLLLAFIAGLMLPRDHRAASRVTLAQPAESVWVVVENPALLLDVWPELTAVTRLPDRDGKPVWHEVVDGFEMTLIVDEAIPPTRLVGRIDAPPDAAFGGRWIYELEPGPGTTTLTVTEEGWIANPLFRVMAAVMGMHRSLDQYLAAVGRSLGESVTPVHVD
jgi:uncharacterized protein YndB with AHSA1/START domain